MQYVIMVWHKTHQVSQLLGFFCTFFSSHYMKLMLLSNEVGTPKPHVHPDDKNFPSACTFPDTFPPQGFGGFIRRTQDIQMESSTDYSAEFSAITKSCH